ncbi:nuclear factor 7, ovary-like [Myxocyprinus asiaticus]|uniref:nuclear factor 7, ovary-like n=1 Tax=Myxocyprinus asiaticus TaxID=70543 RepID=UPI0022223476|nr:nuclear factor 7, ovary-like [Myxocyprinus asiaticus]
MREDEVCQLSLPEVTHFTRVNEELNTALKSLQETLKHARKIKRVCDKTAEHIKTQAEHTEHQIKEEFKKLHEFLRDEEAATITAFREEEEQKSQMMKKKLEETNRHISALKHTIKDMKEIMKANDVSFLKNFNVTMEKVQSSQPDPQMTSGAFIHVPHYLGNLTFRVWKKMQDIIHKTPVIPDPNTANPHLILSDDLTSVRYSRNRQPLPDNPERFGYYFCVLGSEGFDSGTHCWDVEIGYNRYWSIGITTASNQRKGGVFFNTGVWRLLYSKNKYYLQSPVKPWTVFTIKEKLEHVRVQLDYERGKVSFSDRVTNTHLLTFTNTFTETLFPFFYSKNINHLRILPVKLTVTTSV